ncbi:MAG TPA: hypothetical protein DCM05_00865 [Elusimicrobia bacterium]|nr:hypothetical protein [Elusimicrobiota bacterium]
MLSLLALSVSAQTLSNPRITIQGPASGAAGAIRLSPTPFSQPGSILAPITLGAPSILPTAFIPKVQPAAALKAPEAVQAKTVQEMASFQAVLSGEEKGKSVETGLKEAYEGNAVKKAAAEPVLAEPASAQPSGLNPSASAQSSRASVPAPKDASAPGETRWQKLKRIAGNLGSGAVGLYGGWKIGDVAYSVLVHRMPLVGGLAAAAVLAGAAFWSRKTRLAGKPQRPVYPTFIGTFAASVLGNLLWTLTGSPLVGLGLGLALGAGLLLYANGAYAKKDTPS